MNIGFQLYQLQEIDSILDSGKNRINEIEALLTNDKKVNLAETNLAKAKDHLVSSTNEFEKVNDEILKMKVKVSQSESSLYGGSVKNPKELEDLQLEISSLKNSIQKLEDVLMEKLINADEADKIFEKRKQELAAAKSNFATQKALILGEKESITEKIAIGLSKRESLVVQIEKSNISKYEQLRKNKHGLAIAKLQDDTCGACGAGLTASQRQEARSATTLLICPSCGRIIYGSS